MNKLLKNLSAVTIAVGLSLGIVTVSHAAWERFNYSNDCNTAEGVTGAVLVDSGAPDGSAYLKASENASDWLYATKSNGSELDASLKIAFEVIFSGSAIEKFCTWETDVMFTAESSGFSIRSSSGKDQGKVNTTLIYGNDAIRFSNANGTKICDAKLNKWYHVEIVGVYGLDKENAVLKLTISEYNEDGLLTELKTLSYPGAKYGEILRNDNPPKRFAVNPGTCVDNITVTEMPVAAMELVPINETITVKAGTDTRFSANLYADDEKSMLMPGTAVTYELYNADKSDYLISDSVLISEDGLLTVMGATEVESFVIKVSCKDFPDVYDEVFVNVERVPMFEFVGATFADETYKTLVNLKFVQNYENEGDVSFVVAVHNEDGVLKDTFFRTLEYREQTTGEMVITMNEELPKDFNPETDTMKVMVWSKTIE